MTRAVVESMAHDSGVELKELKVDGGMSNSALCMQTQADLVGIPIIRPKMRDDCSWRGDCGGLREWSVEEL